MRRFVLVFIVAICAPAQTTVYVVPETSPEPVIQITNAAENGDYIRIDTGTNPSWIAGDKITIHGVRGCWRVNGTRTIAAVVDGNTFDLLARDGTTVLDCGGTFTAANEAGGQGSRQYWARKLTSATLKAPPNIFGLDGLGGTFTTALQSRDTGDNPAWLAIQTNANAPSASYDGNWAGSILNSAMAWHAAGRPSSSTYKTNAITLLGQFHTIKNHTACDNSSSRTRCGRLLIGMEQDEPDFVNALIAYSYMRSDMSAGERTQFANSVLNDIGQDNGSQTNCTNRFTAGTGTMTVTNGSTTATVSPASGITNVDVGDFVDWSMTSTGDYTDSGSRYYVTAKDAGAGTLTLSIASNVTGTPNRWYYVDEPTVYHAADCGRVWMQRHFNVNTTAAPGGVVGGDPYPTTGGDDTSDDNNLMWWRNYIFLFAGATLCEDDIRGCELFEREQAYFMTRSGFSSRNVWSGLGNGGSAHYGGRTHGPFAFIASTLKAALTPSIDISNTPVTKSLMHRIYQLLPGQGAALHQWGEPPATGSTLLPISRVDDYAMSLLAAGKDDARYYRYWAQNAYSGYTQTNLQSTGSRMASYAFMGIDWADAGLNHTTLPTQHVFGFHTEFDKDIFGNSTAAGGLLGAITKTGWGSTATSIGWFPLGPYRDHATVTSINNTQIFKGHWLYGDSPGSTAITSCLSGTTACLSASTPNNSNIEIGAPTASATSYSYVAAGVIPNFWSFTPANITNGAMARNVRWAGDQYTGRALSEYAALTWDATPIYYAPTIGTTPTYAQHNNVHVKKGGRDYMLQYVTASLPSAKRMRAQLHYPQNGQSTEGNTTSDANGVIRTLSPAANSTSMHTQVLLPSTLMMTDFQMVRTSTSNITVNPQASASYPVYVHSGATHCSFTSSSTITVTPGTTTGAIYIWVQLSDCTLQIGHNSSGVSASAGTVSGGITAFPGSDSYNMGRINVSASGYDASWYYDPIPQSTNSTYPARRFVVELTGAGTATSAEYIVLHEPHGNQSDGATTTTNTQTADWNTVQIDHASLAAVVAFARGNALKDAWSGTTTHAGTAQYIWRGLSPGSYSFACDADTPQVFSVSANDETATVDSQSGVCALARTGTGPPIITTSLPSGTEGVAYSATLQGTCTASPCTWSISVGALPAGLSLTSSTGAITGTPTTAGVSNFTVRYTDNDTLYQERALSITIDPATAPPISFNPNPITCTVGLGCTALVQATDGTPPYTYAATGLTGTGVTLNSDGSWTLDNAAATPGDFSPTITVTDDAMQSAQAGTTLRIVTQLGAADLSIDGSVCGGRTCYIRVSRTGLNANARIDAVLRNTETGAAVKNFNFPAGVATRFQLVEVDPSATYILQAAGDGNAVYGTISTAAASRTSISTPIIVHKGTGVTHIRVRYGGTSALGNTSAITACGASQCAVTLTRDEGPLYVAVDKCSEETCTPPLKPDAFSQPFLVK